MRLKHLYISNYKNLKDFTIDFDNNGFVDIFVGKNGSGKSNLFEALILVFQHIYEFDATKGEQFIAFDYEIHFEIESTKNHISWRSSQLTINQRNRKTFGRTKLPDNLLIYYSGQNETVFGLVDSYQHEFSKKIKGAEFDETRKFIGINSDYKELLLSLMLIQTDDSSAKNYITNKLGITFIGNELKIEFKRPNYANSKEFDIADPSEDIFWKPLGIAQTFLEKLMKCVSEYSGQGIRSEGYFSDSDTFIYYFDIALIQSEFADLSSAELFRSFENLKTLEMLASISVPIKVGNDEVTTSHFSDGQFQSVYVYSIVEFFKDKNCITLFDEPDAFLHPEWQFTFFDQLFELNESDKNHLLISSHSAATMCGLEEQDIRLFHVENNAVQCTNRSKREIINQLSNSLIQYSEDESKLQIDNVIRSSQRPILFVEGATDVSILNEAYRRLYPNAEIPILIQDAFDRGFLKVMMARQNIFADYPQKHFFALFDFDDAYTDWRSLKGDWVQTDIEQGLCKKLDNKSAHVLMLPIPDNQIKLQVWDDSNPIEKVVPKPHFGIEHVFWNEKTLQASWFKEDSRTKIIKFKADSHKVKFAQEVVPGLDNSRFEPFRPMFELIQEKSGI